MVVVLGWGCLSSAPVLELVVVDVFAHVGVDVSVGVPVWGVHSANSQTEELQPDFRCGIAVFGNNRLIPHRKSGCFSPQTGSQSGQCALADHPPV